MAENFNFYYCTVCHVCKNPSKPQAGGKFCSGCRLIQYCSNDHQKQDWPSHRQFCKCVRKILAKTGANHVYEDDGELGKNEASWDKRRSDVRLLMEIFLERPLSTVESQILLFPPVCNFCHRYKPNKMFSCNSCSTVLYCCSEHKAEDKKHLSFCKLLYDSFHVDMLRYFKKSDSEHFALDFPESEPSSMEDIMKKEKDLLREKKLFLSELLSFPLTIVFAIQKSKVQSEVLKVHIVGADSMEVGAVSTFPVIFHYLRQICRFEVVLVGPSIPTDFIVHVPNEIRDRCSVAVSDQKYHDYVKSKNYFTPDLIFVFNCGFCENIDSPENDHWKDSLQCILCVKNSTVVITSYSCSEGKGDLNRLWSKKQNNIDFRALVSCEINPFCSLYPHRDWESQNDDVFYVNKFISVLKSY